MCFFFFQAEDGIRDLTVTGVQTCALPISRNVVSWSAELRRMLGVEPELPDATRAEAFELVHPEDRARVRETLDRTCHDGASYVCEHRIVRRSDGGVRTVQSRGDVVCDEQGQPVRIVGTVQDVTERKQVEEALAQYVALIFGSEDAIMTMALNGTI